ncbi:MAG: peptidylprolyl isomerase [Proteobacteria bacterium]|nr:peptidylprolyl isomerase [Pseudomonadota bacterium]
MKSTFLTAAALGLAPLSLVLWGSAALAQTAAEPAEPAAAAAPEYSIDSALAVVDGVTLTLGELIAIRRELPDQYQALPDEVLFNGIVEQMIDEMLLAQAARAAGLERRPAIALNLLNQQRATLADAYLRQAVAARVTQEAVEARYRERYLDAEPTPEVRAGHILVETEETAIELKAQLDAGADFALLAAEHGTDGTVTQGGDLGWFAHADMVPEFADAAFAMEPGTISAPVRTAFGWHLIRLDERRDRDPPAIDEVREELMGELIQQAQVAVVEELRMQSAIVMPEPPLPPRSIREDAMLEAAE